MVIKKTGKDKTLFTTGKRKKAVARASFKAGKGVVKVNKKPMSLIQNEIIRLKMQEPLILIGDAWKKYNINVNVKGGGMMGQAEAVRQAIAKGLVQLLGKDTKALFMEYDRNLLVYDPRRTEPHKPPHSSWGPRRYKQRSKR
ncbi:MAG: 30S ribosomal protein S9 [Candidatus Aenigmarchaeota archaeon]